MEVASSEALVETDDSFEGYFDYYITGATHEEMVSFKESCEASSWSVIGESEGDFRLQYAETLAGVDLIDMEDYIWISFFVGSDTPVESHTAEEIAGLFNEAISGYGLEASYYEVSSFTGWWLGVYLGESEDDSESSLQAGAYTLASFLPECVLLYSEEYVAATESSDAEYDMFLVSEDYSVGIEVYGYLDSGYLSAEIYIYDLAE